ncbi:MAG: hypothetical protein CO144_01575 [Candidatus Nealsonbacteria bacterium CG_4_9_14_3_um_filter_35_11]|uniref:Uncharacterized protein n=2 Tax=Candidatus Nealsoniibacteriota TaxID=1817911 RepID=A0A2M7DAS4_9BACT|nr:MAG: hypothetical protein COV62_00375 [Candidatus Nealsonbacteria bacterium CG11_big_fil_rev_8_21_14_0_20_35_11]PIV45507.1 MAG: hypothetical protein COS24_01955 [Candidatus Nealsonbacteria bacterium CG02_land_8_20_14_3_00_34_20]PIW92632.1 MAG: hypothetical protein COZ88_01230 [Candidatus Nealsonbacteria bacterium CG_4_8_14_3_um_filter_34_13]PIZ90083.1 MAG: hypothetical protein COX88_00275 [Candidatus Nealsonbacteria bacterium CG_4_10_14_0_2_um_filter_35_20]PJA84491.1 MAG: hypothetical protei
MKNNLVTILAILLVIVLGAGVYFYTNVQGKLKMLQTELGNLQSQVQTLNLEKTDLETKIAQGLAYVEYLDVLLWPMFEEAGITPKFDFSDPMQYLSDVEQRAKTLDDEILIDNLNKIKAGDSKGFNASLIRVLAKLEESLKK